MTTGSEHDAPGIMPFFVYGTLMTNEDRPGDPCWLRYVNRIEQRLIVCGYQLWISHGAFPYAFEDPDPDHYVFGELLWPKDDVAAGAMTEMFDKIESHPDFYLRTEVTVTRSSTSTQQAWMYTMSYDRLRWLSAGGLTCIGASWRVWRDKQHYTKIPTFI